MKIIGRIIAILAAALAIAGATFALAGSSSAAAPNGNFAARRGFEQQPGGAGGEFGRGDVPGGLERGRPAGLFGASELVKNLIIVGVIVAIVAPLARLIRRGRPKPEISVPTQT